MKKYSPTKKHNRTKSASRLIAAMEGMELRRLLSTVTGTVFGDSDRDGRLDAGEAGLAGRTVFADYDYDGVADAAEPIAVTNAGGTYSLATRASQVSLRVVLNANEQLTLGYGATSIWLSTVNGTVSGKNLPIFSAPNSATVRGFVYLDLNGNGVRDAADQFNNMSASVFIDSNNNGVYDDSEPYSNVNANSGEYEFVNIPVGLNITIRVNASNFSYDPPAIFVEPFTWNDPKHVVRTVVGTTAGGNFGLSRQSAAWVGAFAYYDANENGVLDEGERDREIRQAWIELDGNNLRDPGEPLLFSDPILNSSRESRQRYTIQVPTGSWNVSVRYFGDTDEYADSSSVVVASALNWNSVYFVTPQQPQVSGIVFVDTNGNGLQDAGEAGQGGRIVFNDSNNNGLADLGEGYVTTDSSGKYKLVTDIVNVRVRLALNANETLTAGAGGYWFAQVPVAFSGRNFGVVTAPIQSQVTGTIYSDTNRNGRLDTGETGLAGRTVFADYDYDGILDTGEPRALTGANGNYSLATRASQVSLRVAYSAVEQLTLGHGATSIWLPTVNGTVTGKNFGMVPTIELFAQLFVDVDQNGEVNLFDIDQTPDDIWIDLNANSLHDAGEPALNFQRTGLGDPRQTRMYALDVVPGTWRVAVRYPGDTDLNADAFAVRTVTADSGRVFAYFTRAPATSVVMGSVFQDPNGNGNRDANDAGLYFVTVFADLNGNLAWDQGEPRTASDHDGRYALEVGNRSGTLRVSASTDYTQTRGASGYAFAFSSTTVMRNADFGLAPRSAITGTIYSDSDRDGRLDAGETGLVGRTVFADYDYNGVLGLNEPSTTTDAQGNYTLLTRASQVSVRTVLNPGEQLTLGYGTTNFWLPTVNGTVSGKNFGVALPSEVRVQFDFFADHDGDGVQDPSEPDFAGAPHGFSGWLDLDGNDTQNLAAGEISIERGTHTGGAEYFYVYVLPGNRQFQIRANNTSFSSGQSVTANVGPNGGAIEVGIPSDVVPVSITLFDDANGNGIWNRDAGENAFGEFEHFWRGRIVFLDENGDGVWQPSQEASISVSHYTGGRPSLLSPGAYTVVGLLPGERFTTSTTLVVGPSGGTYVIGFGQARNSAVMGTIYSDSNRNGRVDTGEPGLVNRTVFADYNYNGVLDANEPSTTTGEGGAYVLTTRASHVSVRVLLNAGEQLTLGYGATSIWLSTINGTASGNFGIAPSTPATTSIVGYLYLDTNGNGRRDPGELPPQDVIVTGTANGIALQGTLSPTTGQFVFSNIPVGATVVLGASYTVGDTRSPYMMVEPYFTNPLRTIVAQASTQTDGGNFGLTDHFNAINSQAFKDMDQNGRRDLYDPDTSLLARWLDVNANNLFDAGDLPFLDDPLYANMIFRPATYLHVPAGTWRVAIRRAGDTDLFADEVQTVTFGGVDESKPAHFITAPTLPVISGTVFDDVNGNGLRDAGEGGLSTYRSYTIFVDYNGNHYKDFNEPNVQAEFDGRFFFESSRPGMVYVEMTGMVQTFPRPMTAGQPFDPAANQVSGLLFGYTRQASGWVNGTVFVDQNLNGRRDGDETYAPGRLVFADYNYNGQLDANEPSAYTNVEGGYQLPTRGIQVSVRLALSPSEAVSLPGGATSRWISNVGDGVYGQDFGVILVPPPHG